MASYKAGESDYSDLYLLFKQVWEVRTAQLDAAKLYWQTYFNYLYYNNR
jgi:hypothetical protein